METIASHVKRNWIAKYLVASSFVIALAPVTACSSRDSGSQSSEGTEVNSGLFDRSKVHSISLEFDESEFDEMIATYGESGEKLWIRATAVIDGSVFRQVGLRLKGNSSLKGLIVEGDGVRLGEVATDEKWVALDPLALPLQVTLNRNIKDQNHLGETEFAVRSNFPQMSLNEAVALELLATTGLAAQQASFAHLSFNGGNEVLRLVVQTPNETWSENVLGKGYLYKADVGGDYSYRGDDPKGYSNSWDQVAGGDEYGPLIEFLDFVNNAEASAFSSGLSSWLHVEEFARYLAFQTLVLNPDAIDGPGNNSYLYFDETSSMFLVVAWDHNRSFSDARERNSWIAKESPNVLVRRFLNEPGFYEMFRAAVVEFESELFGSGLFETVLNRTADVLLKQSSFVTDPVAIDKELSRISAIAERVDFIADQLKR